MINKIKWWIFRKLCLGAQSDYIFPCAYCKYYVDKTCQLSKKLGL